jgi:hypothetical protein
VSDQTGFDMCPLLGQLRPGGATATCDIRSDLPVPEDLLSVDADRTSDRTRASPLSKVVPFCKTSDIGVDGHDTSESLEHEVELQRGSPCGLRSTSPTMIRFHK